MGIDKYIRKFIKPAVWAIVLAAVGTGCVKGYQHYKKIGC